MSSLVYIASEVLLTEYKKQGQLSLENRANAPYSVEKLLLGCYWSKNFNRLSKTV